MPTSAAPRRTCSAASVIEWALRTASTVSVPCPLGHLDEPSYAGATPGLTEQERHADAALVLKVVERLPELQRSAVLLRLGILPGSSLRHLARHLAPFIGQWLPTHQTHLKAIELALLRAADQPGTSMQAIARALGKHSYYATNWVCLVLRVLDDIAAPAERSVELELAAKGWL